MAPRDRHLMVLPTDKRRHEQMEKRRIRRIRRVALIGIAASVITAGLVVPTAAQGPPTHANRLDATFAEARLVVTDRPDLGVRQVINSGDGTLEGFGNATEIVAVSIDRTLTPCGPGSDTSTVLRRIVVAAGTLVLKTLAHRCWTSSGLVAFGDYEVDGDASTGVFAGAWGSGTDTVQIGTPNVDIPTATISGKLHLRQP
jgi:hypothetical protein